MRIAFLPSASAAMAVALSGDPRSGELLADLARRSLFTECRDATLLATERREGAPPASTFHALFGEFLRARAADAFGADALQARRLEAAALLAAHGQIDAAIARLIDAAAWGEARRLLIAHAAAFVAHGRTQVVRDWLLALPPATRRSPQASYWLGDCELAVRPVETLEARFARLLLTLGVRLRSTGRARGGGTPVRARRRTAATCGRSASPLDRLPARVGEARRSVGGVPALPTAAVGRARHSPGTRNRSPGCRASRSLHSQPWRSSPLRRFQDRSDQPASHRHAALACR